ncbi:MAG TPA: hypothetical protein P5268_07135 [Candidatus Marinimicrobia bacterium]|nr:hypothetical protein [Candidatus Neomarinimicrobiota bacterium]HRU92788.1 hypothetical protein [Candidatus Neomarinimicrobiota bacterium]
MKSTIHYSLADLLNRASDLGNHHRKFVHNIEKNFDSLFALINNKHLIDQFHLLRFSPHPAREMKLIADLVEERETLLEMLGCYYSIQFLLLNFKALDVLKMKLSTTTNHHAVYRSFLLRTGNDFRLLTAAYMNTLLDFFLPRARRPDFVICGVGTRVDQDDIDLGIVDTGPANRAILTNAFGAMSHEMLKYACSLHFHLSEHVGTQGYSASIEDYHNLLDHQIQDFVLISEMVNAVPILGNREIFDRFKNEILDRYYYAADRDNKYHEGFLRGLLGEIRDLMYKEPPENLLNPKRDGLRMLKALIFALKTWKRVEGNTSLEVLDILLVKERFNHENYHRIFQALTFLETFRFFYQLFIVQEEEIRLDSDEVQLGLQKVAYAMGYEDRSYALARTQMLMHYYDHHKIARQGTEHLLEGLTEHLRQITVFAPITHSTIYLKNKTPLPDNVPLYFIQTARFFQGVRFWDDLLSSLDNPNQILLKRFLADFMKLSEGRRAVLAKAYVKWGVKTPYTMISLFSIIADHQPKMVETQFFQKFIHDFIYNLEPTLENVSRLCQTLNLAPQTMNNFLSILPVELLTRLTAIVEAPYWKPEISYQRDTLLMLSRIYCNSSYYFKRFVQRAFNTYAEYITSLINQPKLNQLAEGLFRNIDNFDSLNEKIVRLGDYYDFEFMHLGIALLDGAPFDKINREFTYFSDNYLQMLFELCQEEVATVDQKEVPEMHDLLAVFTAGGHARGQAFDDDYDLIVLLNSDDPAIIDFCNKVIQKMNKYILRRSIIPQFRFADRFRRFVTTFSNLRRLFEHPDENTFIDQSQLLGARMVIGSDDFLQVFQREIVTPFIFQRKAEFIKAMLNEMRSRHNYFDNTQSQVPEIKEGPGGLRDFENFIFILKAHFELADPLTETLFSRIESAIPNTDGNFIALVRDYQLLKHIRDLYRLTVSNDDHLDSAYLDQLVRPFCLAHGLELESGGELAEFVRRIMRKNVERINILLRILGLPGIDALSGK